jgi:hypothetical protein
MTPDLIRPPLVAGRDGLVASDRGSGAIVDVARLSKLARALLIAT